MKRNHRLRRQTALMRLIRTQPVENQEQLVALMRREGFQVSQASISRDIRELGLVKLLGRYVPAARAREPVRSDDVQAGLEISLIIDAEPVGANLIVVKTRVGAAPSVAVVLDQELKEMSIGSVAGDDTIFVAVRSRSDQGQVMARLNTWIMQSRKER